MEMAAKLAASLVARNQKKKKKKGKGRMLQMKKFQFRLGCFSTSNKSSIRQHQQLIRMLSTGQTMRRLC